MATLSAREIARYFRRAARRLPRELRTAEELNLADALDTARKHSSGSLSPADLARMDHPYARRHGTPQLNPAYINIRSGVFYGKWRTFGPYYRGTMLRSRLVNTDSKADKFLAPGTRVMFARPLIASVELEIGPRVVVRRTTALEKAFQP